jgi:hypothetical protein
MTDDEITQTYNAVVDEFNDIHRLIQARPYLA